MKITYRTMLTFVLGIALVALGVPTYHWIASPHNLSLNLGLGTGNNTITDINYTEALRLEKAANASLNSTEEALKWAVMGDGNYEAAQKIIKDNKATENTIAWAGNNLTKTPQSARKGSEWEKLFLVLNNDSIRAKSINQKALDVSRPKFVDMGQEYHEPAAPQVDQPKIDTPKVDNQGNGSQKPVVNNQKSNQKNNLRRGIH